MKVRGLAVALVCFPVCASAVELPVTYSTDFKSFKRTVRAGDTLQFELHADAGCTATVHSEDVTAGGPSLRAEKVITQKVKGQPRPPKIMRLSTVLTPLSIEEQFFLRVVGAGIQGLPEDCQPLMPVRIGAGGISQVDTGIGLQGGPTTTGTISVSAPTCGGTDKLTWNGAAFQCATDQTGGGSVTSVGSGAGLSGGPITLAGTLSVSAPTCTAMEKLTWTGSAFQCAPDADSGGDITQVTAGVGLTWGGSAGAVSLAVNAPVCLGTEKLTWTGSAFQCANDEQDGANDGPWRYVATLDLGSVETSSGTLPTDTSTFMLVFDGAQASGILFNNDATSPGKYHHSGFSGANTRFGLATSADLVVGKMVFSRVPNSEGHVPAIFDLLVSTAALAAAPMVGYYNAGGNVPVTSFQVVSNISMSGRGHLYKLAVP